MNVYIGALLGRNPPETAQEAQQQRIRIALAQAIVRGDVVKNDDEKCSYPRTT